MGKNMKRDVLKRVSVIREIFPRSSLSSYYNDYVQNNSSLSVSENEIAYNTNLQNYINNKNKATAIIDDFFLDRSPRLGKLLKAAKPKTVIGSGPSIVESIESLGRQYIDAGGSRSSNYNSSLDSGEGTY